jgi:hypothetical protein
MTYSGLSPDWRVSIRIVLRADGFELMFIGLRLVSVMGR